MKELICVLIGGFLFLSCNNQNKNKTAEEDLLPDSIPYVEIESYDSSGASTKNKCIKIFEALGDTIFGEVLYGMDIKEANNSVHKFLNKLNSANYSHKRRLNATEYLQRQKKSIQMFLNVVDTTPVLHGRENFHK